MILLTRKWNLSPIAILDPFIERDESARMCAKAFVILPPKIFAGQTHPALPQPIVFSPLEVPPVKERLTHGLVFEQELDVGRIGQRGGRPRQIVPDLAPGEVFINAVAAD